MKGNAIIPQSGGPTAVINSSACGVIQTWLAQATGCGTIYAGISGVKGILEGDIIDLAQQPPELIDGLRHTPGAGLYSCRYKVSDADQEQLVSILKKLNIRYFFYNGGNDSMDTAHKTWLAAQSAGWEMRVIGVPKTIDNDLWGTDMTFGFQSAVDIATDTIDRIHTTATSHSRVFIIEVMGHKVGHVTLHAGIAGGADIILIPEIIKLEQNSVFGHAQGRNVTAAIRRAAVSA